MKYATILFRSLIVVFFAITTRAETNALSLARICTAENKRDWVSVSGFCHVLDFYGLGKTDLPLVPSGEVALKALTDEETAIRFFGKSPFVGSSHGVHYALYDEFSVGVDLGEAHRDQCLSAFASLNLPLSTPVHLKGKWRSYTLADVLSDSMANFSLKQRELEWSAMAFAKYVPPRTAWTNVGGEQIDFSTLVGALLAVDLNSEKCGGTHVFEALALIEQADRKQPILDEATRARLEEYLKATLEQIVKSQKADGSWSKAWRDGIRDESDPMTPFQMSFLVTGHLLEILNRIEPPLRPKQEVFVKAAKWVSDSVKSPEIEANGFWVCPFTHAAHGAQKVL